MTPSASIQIDVIRHGLADLDDSRRTFLSEIEQSRADRFRLIDDVRRFITGRIIARTEIALRMGCRPDQVDLRIRPDTHRERGRPYVAGFSGSFSISHSGEALYFAVSDSPVLMVGVDVEDPTTVSLDTYSAISQFLPRDEAPVAGWDTGSALRDWVRREAVVKAFGIGLLTSPTSLILGKADTAPLVLHVGDEFGDFGSVALTDIDDDEYVASLAWVSQPQSLSPAVNLKIT